MARKHVAVLMGGFSSERQVSLWSGNPCADALERLGYRVSRIDVDRVPVQINASSVAYLKDAVWVERPTRQFRRLLAETVRAKADRIVLEGTDFEVKGKTTVAGRLSQMGYDAVRQTVVVRYDAVVEDGGAVRTRRFEAEVPGIPASAAAVGPALNEAANTVAKEAAAWILGG